MAKKNVKNIRLENQQEEVGGNIVSNPASPKWSLLDFRTQSIVLAVICFLFYFNTFSNESAFDDRMAITGNEYVQQGFAGIPDILTKDAYQSYLENKNGSNQLAGGRYRPLSLITFAAEQQLMGVNNDNETPDGKEARLAKEMPVRHVVNVLLYMLSVIVLLYFLRYVVFPRDPLLAFLAALLFTIHPIHTEVVANVKSRDEILSLLFISLTFIKAFRYRDDKKKSDLVLALFYFFLALLSKEYAVTLLALLPVSFYLFRKDTPAKSVKAFLPYLIPLGIYFMLRFAAVTGAAEGAENNVMNNPYLYATGLQKIASEIMVLLDYLKLLVFPNVLSADYSYNQIPYVSFSDPVVLLSLLIYLALTAGMCLLILKRHKLGFAIAFYLANLVLVSNLFFNIGAPMGERLIYHSSVGFCIAAAWLFYFGFKKIKQPVVSRAALAATMVVIIIFSGYKTIARNREWKNDDTLFMADVQKVPKSVLANNNAAAACMDNAKHAPDQQARNEWFEKAIKYYDKAIAIYPGHMLAHLNRGLSYFDLGMPDRALPDWDTVRKYNPGEQNLSKYLSIAGKYFYGQGVKYSNANMPDSAIIEYEHCAEATPEIADAWYNLGVAYAAKRDYKEAEPALAKALQIAPGYEQARKLYEQIKIEKAE